LPPVGEEHTRPGAGERDKAAARRDVDAGIRDRMADEAMSDTEREARANAARDRMAAMRDRQEAAQDRDRERRPEDNGGSDGDA
jgi:hypothetical protein